MERRAGPLLTLLFDDTIPWLFRQDINRVTIL
jgi:hypothetical protein